MKAWRIKQKNADLIAMRGRAVEMFTDVKNCPNEMFRVVRGLKTDSKEVEGGRCMRRSDGNFCLREGKR